MENELDNELIHKQIQHIRTYLLDMKLDGCTKQAILEGALGVEKAVTNAEVLKSSLLAMMQTYNVKQ